VGSHCLAAWLLLLFALVSVPGWTDSAGQTDLGSVAVTAPPIEANAAEVPSAQSVVTAADMAARGALTVADAVKVVPGLVVTDYGPAGAVRNLSLHGSTSNQVLVLVDGVRVNNALAGAADIGTLTTENLAEIDVLRDGASALYGGDAVGGVVNLVTNRAPSPLRLSFENSGYLPTTHVVNDSFDKSSEGSNPLSLVDGQSLRFSWAPQVGEVVWRTSGRLTRVADAYTFTDANGDVRQLQNAGYAGGAGALGLSWNFAAGTVDADLSGQWDSRGVPGPQASRTLQASQTDLGARGVLRYTTDRFFTDGLDLEASVHGSYAQLDYTNPASSGDDGHHKVLVAGTDWRQKAWLSDSVSLLYGGSGEATAAASNTVGDPRRLTLGVYVQPLVQWGRLSLRPALRYDWSSDFTSSGVGPLGATLAAAWKASDLETLRVSVNRSYRVPTFDDLYWPSDSSSQGNPSLVPETAYAGEVGYDRVEGATTTRATAFVRYAQDVILWQAGDGGIWRPSNYGAALYPGFEAEYKTTFDTSWTLGANYTFLYSYALSGSLTLADNKRLPLIPIHAGSLTLGRELGALAWSATGHYTGARFLKVANVGTLDAVFTLDALVRWSWTPGSQVYFAADNLFGQDYESVSGYPMPGTKLRAGVDFSL